MGLKIIAIGFILLSCTPAPEITSGGTSTDSPLNAEAPFIWPKNSFPKKVLIANSFTKNELTSITDMGSAWRDSLKTDFFELTSRTSDSFNLDSPDGILGIYKATVWPSDVSSDALAITQLFGRRFNAGTSSEYVRIEHADIIVNYSTDKYGNTFAFNSDPVNVDKSKGTDKDSVINPGDDGGFDPYKGFDLRTIILHEMGHFLGLHHIPSWWDRPDEDQELSKEEYKASSVMYPSISSSEIKRIPQKKDIYALINKYNIGAQGSFMVSQKSYVPLNNDKGKNTRIILELKSNGECVHKRDGIIVKHHRLRLK